jgi:hypothetical protein
MGTWGTDLLDNDAAADAVGYWNEFIAHGLTVEPAFWTAERIYDLLRVSYLRDAADTNLAAADRASEILAVAVMFLDAGLTLPAPALDLVARAANVQLERAQLRDWGTDSRRRRAALESLLTRIGRDPMPEHKQVDPEQLELRKWRAWSKHYAELVHCAIALVAPAKDSATYNYSDLEPPLVRTLENLVRTKEGNRELGAAKPEIVKHRLMALAFRLGVFLELPEQEVLVLISLAEEGQGEIYRRQRGVMIPTLRERLPV